MNQEKLNELLEKQKERFEKVYNNFEIGQHVELASDSYDDEALPIGAEGVVLDKQFGEYGCDLKIDFEGYETWIDAEDVC